MLRGLYTVSTVLEQNTRALDVMSNNLANINSTGYKRDIAQYEEFASVLVSKVNGNIIQSPAASHEVFVEQTEDSHILTVDNGYFKVAAPGGTSHHHSVEFRVGEDGYLRTLYRNGNHDIIKDAGYLVLGQNGPIKVADKDFSVDERGNLTIDGAIADKLVHKQPVGTLGTLSGGVKMNRIVSLQDQAELRNTQNAFDLALNSPGFFTLETPFGERYTRNGQFKMTTEGQLVSDDGYAVVGLEGPIVLSSEKFTVNRYGEIVEGGLIVDKLKIVNPSNIERMKKFGSTLFRFDGDMEEQGYAGDVMQGYLENSNVNGLKEMIQIMETYRAYESAQRVVRSYDEMIGKAVNEVGQV